jgi:DNA-binding GntR family transcriptional regulator
MSPVPIREALRRLDTLGLLEHVPHRGVSVVHLSREDLSDIYAVRLALEPIAVRRAAERFTANDGALAERYLRDHEDAYRRRDVRDVLQTNRDFHFTLYRASGSKWLVRQIELPWDACERYRATVFRAHGVTKLRGPERESHERVLAACVDRDPDRAAEELSRHLSLFSTFVLEQLHE